MSQTANALKQKQKKTTILQDFELNEIDPKGIDEIFSFLSTNYFRAEIIVKDENFQNDLETKPFIFIANHSGMGLSWDSHIMHQKMKSLFSGARPYVRLVTPLLYKSKLMEFFGIRGFRPLDAVPASMKNFESLVESYENVLIFPEGIAGIGKGYDKKYQLQKFSTSFVRMGLKYDREIVPVSIINGEWLNPVAFNFKFANPIGKILGLPFFPMGLTTPIWMALPFFFYTAMPAKLKYIIGPRMKIRDFTKKTYETITETEIQEITVKIQSQMQAALDKHVEEYGQVRFDFPGLFKHGNTLGLKGQLLQNITWPIFFHYKALKKGASVWKKIDSALTCLAMYLPVAGWLVLLVLNWLRPRSKTLDQYLISED